MFCAVTTTVRYPDDTRRPGAVLYFTIHPGSYTIDSQYPRGSIRAVADTAGNISVNLWIDSTGAVPTDWWVRYESGEVRKFSIPPGTVTDTLEHLLGLPNIQVPSSSSIQSEIATQVAAAIAAHNANTLAHPGLAGGGGGTVSELTRAPLTYAASGSYTLPIAPADPASVQLFVNGAKQHYGPDYTITGTVLAWISPSFTLTTTDTIEAYL